VGLDQACTTITPPQNTHTLTEINLICYRQNISKKQMSTSI
jgi:hypothetical protein